MPEQIDLLAALLGELSTFEDPTGVKQVLEHRVEPRQIAVNSGSATAWVFAEIPISGDRVVWLGESDGPRWMVVDDEGKSLETDGHARLEDLWILYAYHVCCVDSYEKLLETALEKRGSILVADITLSQSTHTELTPAPWEINAIVTDRAGRKWRFAFFRTATVGETLCEAGFNAALPGYIQVLILDFEPERLVECVDSYLNVFWDYDCSFALANPRPPKPGEGQIGKLMKCRYPGVYETALTYSQTYEVVAYKPEQHQYRVLGDNGRHRWFAAGLFVDPNEPTPKFTRFRADPHTFDLEIDVWFDDGSWGWFHIATPEFVSRGVASNGQFRPGSRIIYLATLEGLDVGATLKKLERDGELIELAQPETERRPSRPLFDSPGGE